MMLIRNAARRRAHFRAFLGIVAELFLVGAFTAIVALLCVLLDMRL